MAGNLFEHIEINRLVNEWAKITIEKWRKELRKKKVGVTDELYNSFTYEVQKHGEAISGILLKYKYYGRFTDMGVGKGLKANERGNNRANAIAARRYGANVSSIGRKPSKWLNKIKTAQTYRLREILAFETRVAISGDLSGLLSSEIRVNVTSS